MLFYIIGICNKMDRNIMFLISEKQYEYNVKENAMKYNDITILLYALCGVIAIATILSKDIYNKSRILFFFILVFMANNLWCTIYIF